MYRVIFDNGRHCIQTALKWSDYPWQQPVGSFIHFSHALKSRHSNPTLTALLQTCPKSPSCLAMQYFPTPWKFLPHIFAVLWLLLTERTGLLFHWVTPQGLGVLWVREKRRGRRRGRGLFYFSADGRLEEQSSVPQCTRTWPWCWSALAPDLEGWPWCASARPSEAGMTNVHTHTHTRTHARTHSLTIGTSDSASVSGACLSLLNEGEWCGDRAVKI